MARAPHAVSHAQLGRSFGPRAALPAPARAPHAAPRVRPGVGGRPGVGRRPPARAGTSDRPGCRRRARLSRDAGAGRVRAAVCAVAEQRRIGLGWRRSIRAAVCAAVCAAADQRIARAGSRMRWVVQAGGSLHLCRCCAALLPKRCCTHATCGGHWLWVDCESRRIEGNASLAPSCSLPSRSLLTAHPAPYLPTWCTERAAQPVRTYVSPSSPRRHPLPQSMLDIQVHMAHWKLYAEQGHLIPSDPVTRSSHVC
jgi:hypothetical protein